MNRVTALAQFNKLNKKFITVLSGIDDAELLNHDLYLYTEIEIDLDQETVTGDFDNHSVVAIVDQPTLMTEDSLNSLARERIFAKYTLEQQLSIIEELLERLADAAGIEATDIKEMNDHIREVKRANAIRKEFFANNPDYIYKTTEEFEADLAEIYDGGINDYDQK